MLRGPYVYFSDHHVFKKVGDKLIYRKSVELGGHLFDFYVARMELFFLEKHHLCCQTVGPRIFRKDSHCPFQKLASHLLCCMGHGAEFSNHFK